MMFNEFSLTAWLALGILILFGYTAIKTKNTVMMLLGFLIPVLIAASLLGFFDLAQGVALAVLLLAVAVIAFAFLLVYKFLRQIGGWVSHHDDE
jgi:hypothetical protein